MISAKPRHAVPKAALTAFAWSFGVLALAEPSLTLHPLFQGNQRGGGLVPIVAEVTTDDAETSGTVRVVGGGYSMSYPVKLAKNTPQQVQILLPLAENGIGEMPVIELQTRTKRISRTFDPSVLVRDSGTSILEIGGQIGELGFTETNQPRLLMDGRLGETAPWSVAYAPPNIVPERPAAFESFHFVFLGKGAERLTDAAVAALKNYMLLGGIVVVPGGAASVSSLDPRWSDVLPGHPGPAETVSDTQPLSQLCYSPLSERFKAWPLQLRKGSRAFMSPKVLVASRQYGLGEVVQFAFDPFDGILKNWAGRLGLLGLVGMDTGVSFRSTRDLAASVHPTVTAHEDDTSPFELKMPKASKIGWLLVAYVTVVVPLNFLALRKLDRGELAWLSAPLISIAFAGAVLGQASGLYGFPTAHRTVAVAIAQDDSPTLVAMGKTDVFFAKGGQYDLKLLNVDSLSPGYLRDTLLPAQESGVRDLEPIDTGKEVQIRTADVPNLAFRSFGFRQVAKGSLVKVTRRAEGYLIEAFVEIEDAEFQSPEGHLSIGDLDAGQTTFLAYTKMKSPIAPQDRTSNNVEDIARALSKRQAAVWGVTKSLPFGTALGVADACSTTFIYLSRDVR